MFLDLSRAVANNYLLFSSTDQNNLVSSITNTVLLSKIEYLCKPRSRRVQLDSFDLLTPFWRQQNFRAAAARRGRKVKTNKQAKKLSPFDPPKKLQQHQIKLNKCTHVKKAWLRKQMSEGGTEGVKLWDSSYKFFARAGFGSIELRCPFVWINHKLGCSISPITTVQYTWPKIPMFSTL